MDVSIAENIKHLGEVRRQEGYRHTHQTKYILQQKNFSSITICNNCNLWISIDYYTMQINWYKERDKQIEDKYHFFVFKDDKKESLENKCLTNFN